jgi:DNA-binding MarR family transcriptional regulator
MSTTPMTASDLARVTGISTAAATGLVDRLEAAGYVRRVPDSNDRRRTTIELAGDRVAAGLGPAFGPLLQRWSKSLSGYSEEQLSLVGEVLSTMTASIDHEVGALRKA